MSRRSPSLLLPPLLLLLSAPAAHALPKAASILAYDPSETFASQLTPLPSGEGYAVYQATFPSQVKTLFPANDTVWARFMVPEGPGPHPCVVVLPMLAGSDARVEAFFWESLLERGIAVLFVELPHQFHRRTRGARSGMVFLGRSPEVLRANFAQAVLDVRRSVTWLTRRPEVDPARIAIMGLSLGALVGSAAYAVDPRFSDAVFLLGGAGLADLLKDSALTGPILRRLAIPPERMKLLEVEIDPFLYKEANRGRPALLVNAMWDRVIPAAYGRRLHEAFPASRQVWVPFGHYSSAVHLVWMPGYAARYLQESFASGR